MASKSYYTVDERTRRSVMAAQGPRSINDVHESRRVRFSREFDQNAFLATIGNVEAVIEGLCLNGSNGWNEVSRLQPDIPRLSSRLFEGSSIPPVLEGHDRATLSLYDPIQNLGEMCDNFHSQVNAWATKATYYSEVISPMIIRNTKGSTSETETARLTREALEFVGPIDRAYVKRFSAFGRSMVDPIVKLKSLERFIASILMEKYDICFDDSKDEKTEGRANPHHGVPSGVKGPSALAQYVDGAHEKPSPPPQEDLKDDSASSTENPGSNRNEHYNSKPSFPIDATTIPALALALPYLTINEPSRAPESSSALQGRSTLYDTKPDTAPQGTPQWKIDLSERKGHRIHLLHVGDSELGILAKCLSYLYNVTSKADECFDFIIKKRGLAKHMKKEYEQWAGACGYRKDTFTKASKGEKSTKKGGTRLEYNHGSDFDERKHRLSAKAPLSGSRYVPYTLDPDTAMGYGPYNDADANASGYRQLQIAAQSSFPSPDAQQQLRQGPSIIDLEDYDLDSESDSRSATPTPTDQSSSPAASSLFHASDISMDSPSDFRMASPSSSEDEGSQDSDRTVRRFSYSTYEGEGARRGLGSPVPFADYDDDDMDEGYDDDAGSEDSESTVGAGVGTLGAGGYATLGSASRGMSTPTSTIAAQNDEAANNVTDDSHNTKHDTEHPTHQPQKSLRDRNGRRVGVYGEEL